MNVSELVQAVTRESQRLLKMNSEEILKIDSANESGSVSTSVCINVGMELLVTAIASQKDEDTRAAMLKHVLSILGANLKAAFIENEAEEIIRRAMKKDQP